MMEVSIISVLNMIAASLAFGVWKKSVWAGAFLINLLIGVSIFIDDIVKFMK